jgi:glucokinase
LNMNPEKRWIGIDIGKTKVAAGIVNEKGLLIRRRQVPTDVRQGGYAIIEQVKSLVNDLLEEIDLNSIKGIGIGSSGVIDHKNGIILSSGSIPNWHDIQAKKIMEHEFGIETTIDNDVYVGALGEHYFGMGTQSKNSIYFTIGTGVGVAIIQDGRILHGTHGLAGQIAHLPLFNEKTVNETLGGRGIENEAEKLLGEPLTTSEIFRKAERGDKYAKEIVARAARGAGMVIAWLQNTIDPNIFILGGSVFLKQDKFIEEVKRHTESYMRKYELHVGNGIELRKAKLGENAVIVGGAALWISPVQLML